MWLQKNEKVVVLLGNNKLPSFILLLSVTAVLCLLLAQPAVAQNKAFIVTVESDMFYILDNTSIYIDGTLYGVTDVNGVLPLYNFPAGMHNLTAARPGYINQTVSVNLVSGGSYDFALFNEPPPDPRDSGMTIYVVEANEAKTLVAGAMVYIDGEYVGLTDNNYGMFVSDASDGPHEVIAYRKGMINSSSMSITFTKGGSYTIVLQNSGKKLAIFDIDLLLRSLRLEVTNGMFNTIKLSLVAFAVGMIIGLIMGLGRVSSNRVFRLIASVYIEGVRGLPLLLQLMFVNYALPFMYMDLTGNVLPMDIFTACVIALAANSGSYMGEIFKAGIQAIHKGQMEAARSLGMSYNQSMRHVILPQAFKIVLPALGNEFIALIKDSSISMVVSYHEIIMMSRMIGTETYNSFTPLFAAGIVYLCITVPLGWGVKYLEHRFNVNVMKPRETGSGWLGMRKKKPVVNQEQVIMLKEVENER